MALSGRPADALCLVELRGFGTLTPCLPSRNPGRPAATKPRITGHSTEAVAEAQRAARKATVATAAGEPLNVPTAEAIRTHRGLTACRASRRPRCRGAVADHTAHLVDRDGDLWELDQPPGGPGGGIGGGVAAGR